MSDDLIERLDTLADCDARAGEPLGRCMREAATRLAVLEVAKSGLIAAHEQFLVEQKIRDARIRALETELTTLRDEAQGVKPLEWWEPSKENNYTHGARTFFCTYYVGICGGRHNAFTEIFHEGQGIEQWDGPTRGRLAEAKEDAQADYARRILSALTPAPVSDHGDQCDCCGRNYRTVYRVPNDLWAQIAPRPDTLGPHPEHQGGGLLCSECATDAAGRHGVQLTFEVSESWGAPVSVGDGVAAIAAERQRQMDVEGWTPEHDDSHIRGEMGAVAACYAVPSRDRLFALDQFWPPTWDYSWWKPSGAHDDLTARRRDLVKAGALIAAEIDRLDRAALRALAGEGE